MVIYLQNPDTGVVYKKDTETMDITILFIKDGKRQSAPTDHVHSSAEFVDFDSDESAYESMEKGDF